MNKDDEHEIGDGNGGGIKRKTRVKNQGEIFNKSRASLFNKTCYVQSHETFMHSYTHVHAWLLHKAKQYS